MLAMTSSYMLSLVFGAVAIIWGFWAFFRAMLRRFSYDRIKTLLSCTTKQAKSIEAYLQSEGILYLTFHRWACGAENAYMPSLVFRGGGNDGRLHLYSTWSETREALLSLCLAKKLNRRWTVDDAIDKVGEEIMRLRSRRGHNPLSHTQRTSDIIEELAKDDFIK